MLKVVHVVSSFSLGGVQTGMLYSIEELNKEFDYTVITYKADENWLKEVPSGIKKHITILGASTIFSGTIKSFRLLQIMKPDVVVASLWKSVPAAIMYKIFNPKVCLCGFYHQNGIIHFLERFFLKVLSKKQDMAFADSAATKKFIKEKLSVENTVVVPYLFNFNTLHKTTIINHPKIKLVFFGRLAQVKRVDRMLLFCKLCKEAGINFQFDIYGKGDAEKYKAIIDNYKLQNEVTIKDLLPLNKIQPTMLQYDFLLQLSDIEGMALSVVEGLSCGLIPLVTPVGEIENYTKDGVNALWLYPDFDKNLPLLVEKLLIVLKTPETYKSLSYEATQTFKTQKKYVESFCEGINDFIKRKSSL